MRRAARATTALTALALVAGGAAPRRRPPTARPPTPATPSPSSATCRTAPTRSRPSRAGSSRSTPTRRAVGDPPRRHQERLVAVQRRVLRVIRADFDTFEDPLVYTPGDNEWTDCHRANNGAYNPLERLATVREVVLRPARAARWGRTVPVDSQAGRGFPENVSYRRARDHLRRRARRRQQQRPPAVDRARQHRSRRPSSSQASGPDRRRHRRAARRRSPRRAQRHDRGVVVMQQADMFDPTYTPTEDDISAFQPLVQALVDEASRFDGPVYLLDGDSHVYNSDRPLATGSLVADDVRRPRLRGQPDPGHRRRLVQQQRLPAGDRRAPRARRCSAGSGCRTPRERQVNKR